MNVFTKKTVIAVAMFILSINIVKAQLGPVINEDFVATKTAAGWAVLQPTATGNTRDVDATMTQNATTGVVTITPATLTNTGTQVKRYRGDVKYSGGTVTINQNTHPILAIKFTKPTTGNVIFEIGSAYAKSGTTNTNNQYVSSGNDVYYYDLTPSSGAKLGGVEITSSTTISSANFQFKIADLTTYQSYDIHWIKSFASVAALNAYVQSTLPVSLTSYNLNLLKTGKVALDWKVSSETNNNFFRIERKSEDGDFKEIAKVNSKGSGANSYQFVDGTASIGNNYYRLSQIDLDGTTEILDTKIISVGLIKEAPITVYPNPIVGEGFTFKFISKNPSFSAALSDAAGRSIFAQNFATSADGDYKVNLKQSLAPGMYILSVDNRAQKLLVR